MITSIDSMEDFGNMIRDNMKRSVDQLLNACQGNVDLSIIDKPVVVSKNLTMGGRKISYHIHCENKAVDAVADIQGKKFKSLIQVFTKEGSIIVCFTPEMITNACLNWRDEIIINEVNDLLTATVAAWRLNSEAVIVHHLAMDAAYENDDNGVDANKCHSVWD